MEKMKNIIELAGTVQTDEQAHHPLYGRREIKTAAIEVERDSGVKDSIILLFQEEAVDREGIGPSLRAGERVMVAGHLQTFKEYSNGRIVVFVWCEDLRAAGEKVPEQNGITISGQVAKEPIYRKTEGGREITEILLKIPSIFTEGFFCMVPVITWGGNARKAKEYGEGDTIEVVGRLQSRKYIKNKGRADEYEREVNEISAARIERTEAAQAGQKETEEGK